MSTLCKSRMVEGQSGKTGYLTAKISVFTRQSDRFCCVTNDTFFTLVSFTHCGACH